MNAALMVMSALAVGSHPVGHCSYPGVIPGTEHPTLCQRIKDALCPNRCMPPKHARERGMMGYSCHTCAGTVIYSEPAPARTPMTHVVDKPVMREGEIIGMPRVLKPMKSAPIGTSPYGVQPLPMPKKVTQPRTLELGTIPE